MQRQGLGVIKMLIIVILFSPDIILAKCETSLEDINPSIVMAFDGNVIWQWIASEAVAPLDQPMPESFKEDFKEYNGNQVIYKGELHLLLRSLGNLALLRFDDKAIVWDGSTDILVETASLTEKGNIIAVDSNGFKTIINTSECNEEN